MILFPLLVTSGGPQSHFHFLKGSLAVIWACACPAEGTFPRTHAAKRGHVAALGAVAWALGDVEPQLETGPSTLDCRSRDQRAPGATVRAPLTFMILSLCWGLVLKNTDTCTRKVRRVTNLGLPTPPPGRARDSPPARRRPPAHAALCLPPPPQTWLSASRCTGRCFFLQGESALRTTQAPMVAHPRLSFHVPDVTSYLSVE